MSNFHPFNSGSAVGLLAALLWLLPAWTQAKPHFDLKKDSFSFSNDTVFAYGVDEQGELTMHRQEHPPEFAHSCFLLSRSVLQFHKFARFEPKQPRISSNEYRALVKRITRISAWRSPLEQKQRIVIPGYANLYEFSRARERLLKEELGNWRPTYLRIGNWRMVGPFPRIGQRWAAERLTKGIDAGKLEAVYLTRFPKMNHVVVLYDYCRLANGDIRFSLYDPNYPGEKGSLLFTQAQSSFEFPKRWFWTGGRVNLMRVYISPFH